MAIRRTHWDGVPLDCLELRAIGAAAQLLARSEALAERAGGLVAGAASEAALMDGIGGTRRIFYGSVADDELPEDDAIAHGRLVVLLDFFNETASPRPGGAIHRVRRDGEVSVMVADRGRYAAFGADALDFTRFAGRLAAAINQRDDEFFPKGFACSVENVYTDDYLEEQGNALPEGLASPRLWRALLSVAYHD